MRHEISRMETPLGPILWAEHDGALIALEFAASRSAFEARLAKRDGHGVTFARGRARGPIARRLRAYFGGDLRALDDIPVAAHGTPFQRRVWDALRRIPAGRTASYREIATRVGAPSASRAVGSANAANPVALVVPCHRVVRSDGSLCGYAGGVSKKAWLLEHEGTRGASAHHRRGAGGSVTRLLRATAVSRT